MSYCVNCGVELAPSERKCPLCDTPVLNPNEDKTIPVIKPYSSHVETVINSIDRKFLALLVTLLLMIPIFISMLSDILVHSSITWSLYVLCGGICTFCVYILPFMFKKPNMYLCIILDAVSLLGLQWIIDFRIESTTFFGELSIPITIGLSLFCMLFLMYQSKQKRILKLIAMFLFEISGFMLILNLTINSFLNISLIPQWAGFAIIPCVITGIFCLVLNRRNKWIENIKKRLFI